MRGRCGNEYSSVAQALLIALLPNFQYLIAVDILITMVYVLVYCHGHIVRITIIESRCTGDQVCVLRDHSDSAKLVDLDE